MTAAMGIPSGGEGAGLADSPPTTTPTQEGRPSKAATRASAGLGWAFVIIAGNPGNPAR